MKMKVVTTLKNLVDFLFRGDEWQWNRHRKSKLRQIRKLNYTTMYTVPFGLLFDMDGVIVDSNPLHVETLREFFDKYGKTISDEDMEKHIFGRRNQEWLRFVFGDDTSEADIEAYTQEKEKMFRDRAHSLPALDGLPNFLEEMKKYKVPMAVATSAPRENMDFILDKLDIRRYFKAFIWSDHVTEGKPHPEVYQLAAEAIGLQNKQCVVLEDSMSGVKAGLDSNSKVVALTTTHDSTEFQDVDLTVKDFRELTFDKLASLFPNVEPDKF